MLGFIICLISLTESLLIDQQLRHLALKCTYKCITQNYGLSIVQKEHDDIRWPFQDICKRQLGKSSI